MRQIEGEAGRGFSYIIGHKSLKDSLSEYEKAGTRKYQRLVIPYSFGEDPDDGFSTVPYDKGSNLLLLIERTVGGLDAMLPYMYDYVSTFRGRSISTADWRAHLFAYFAQQKGGKSIVADLESKIDWDAWLHGEGTSLPVKMEYDTTLADKAYALAEKWATAAQKGTDPKEAFSKEDLKEFSSNQTVVFLETLESKDVVLSSNYLKTMNELYGFDGTGNVSQQYMSCGLPRSLMQKCDPYRPRSACGGTTSLSRVMERTSRQRLPSGSSL